MALNYLLEDTCKKKVKKIFILSLLLVASIHVCAQDFKVSQDSNKYGVINLKGDTIVPFIYDHIDPFKNGFAKITKKDKIGVVNTSAVEVIPCVYDEIKDIEDGMAIVSKYGVYGVVNTNNDTIILIRNQSISNYYQGTYMVYKDYLFGVIDTTGANTVPFGASIGIPFSGGDGYIISTNSKNNDQKIIDRHNNEIFVFPGYGVRDFNNGYLGIWKKKITDKLAIYLNKNKNQAEEIVTYKIVNIEGEVINDSLTIEYNLVFNNGFSRISRDNKIGVINIKGKQVIPCEYSKIYDFENGYAKVKQDSSFMYGNNKYGIVTNKGKLIVPCLYDGLGSLKEDRILALLNHKYGYLNNEGKHAIPFEYDYAQNYDNEYAIVGNKNKQGVIDKQGKQVIPLLYDQVKSIDGESYIVTQNLQFGITNIEGKIQTPIKYKSLKQLPQSKYIVAQIDQTWGIIDVNDNVIIPFDYKEIMSYSEGLFVVKPHPSATHKK